jgi:fumarate hydratase class II
MLVTALSPVIGYDKASELALYADKNNCTLKDANIALKLVSDKEFDRIVDPYRMAYPHKGN